MSCAERLSGSEHEQSFPSHSAFAGRLRVLEARIP
jgi:hypothetical protein